MQSSKCIGKENLENIHLKLSTLERCPVVISKYFLQKAFWNTTKFFDINLMYNCTEWCRVESPEKILPSLIYRRPNKNFNLSFKAKLFYTDWMCPSVNSVQLQWRANHKGEGAIKILINFAPLPIPLGIF